MQPSNTQGPLSSVDLITLWKNKLSAASQDNFTPEKFFHMQMIQNMFEDYMKKEEEYLNEANQTIKNFPKVVDDYQRDFQSIPARGRTAMEQESFNVQKQQLDDKVNAQTQKLQMLAQDLQTSATELRRQIEAFKI